MSLNIEKTEISTKELAQLGTNKIGYTRMMTSKQVLEIFPETENILPDMEFWALFAADGEPLALADHPDAVLSSAFDNDLKTVSVH
ncbi:MAG: DUF1150 family protein [Rhizobiaceae bacterium]|nr:DUF1150 family protein [Rhizobiaceae bacterium]MBL4695496.1 DUF1150 family protein [Rhizobiaceae bacterium]